MTRTILMTIAIAMGLFFGTPARALPNDGSNGDGGGKWILDGDVDFWYSFWFGSSGPGSTGGAGGGVVAMDCMKCDNGGGSSVGCWMAETGWDRCQERGYLGNGSPYLCADEGGACYSH